MWMIAAALGMIALVAGLCVKAPRARRVLVILGALLLAAGLAYGVLVALLLGGIG